MKRKPGRRLAAARWFLAATGGALLVAHSPAEAAQSSNGINLNAHVGAERFYDAGYTGTLTIQANIEGGHAWSGHESLGHIDAFIDGIGDTGFIGRHPTATAHLLGGRPAEIYDPTHKGFGIAFGATLWSGSFGWETEDDDFQTDQRALGSTYVTALHDGIGGVTADVTNGSWGFSADKTGQFPIVFGVDGMVNGNSAAHVAPVTVWSVGNSGSGSNTVGGPASGYNNIAVGGVQSQSTTPAYSRPWGTSSRGPQDFEFPDGTIVEGVRAAVDITAPGTQIQGAYTTTGESSYSQIAGTSAASPMVAGGASLMIDAGRSVFAGDPHAVDARVIKAALLNSAEKTHGWSNAQQMVDGVLTTTQSLDWVTGAGSLNLDRGYDQYVAAGTTGVAMGSGNLGAVAQTGWDYGYVNDSAMNTYFIEESLQAGTGLTATLTWFVDRDPGVLDPAGPMQNYFSGASDDHFANLELSVFRFDNLDDMNVLDVVAESISLYNNTEHLHFDLDAEGYYGLGVTYNGSLWNSIDETGEYYGLAWSTAFDVHNAVAVPTPTTAAMGAVLLLGLLTPRRGRTRV